MRPRRDSRAFEEFWEEGLSEEEAKRILMIAHYRHEHTKYEEIGEEEFLDEEERARFKEALEEYFRAKEEGEKLLAESYLEEIRFLRAKGHKRKKEHFNRIALEMLREDGLLPSS